MYRKIYNNEIYHYGIIGQKWGERRYQNADGSLTPEGISRYKKFKNKVRTKISDEMGYALHFGNKRDADEYEKETRNRLDRLDKVDIDDWMTKKNKTLAKEIIGRNDSEDFQKARRHVGTMLSMSGARAVLFGIAGNLADSNARTVASIEGKEYTDKIDRERNSSK